MASSQATTTFYIPIEPPPTPAPSPPPGYFSYEPAHPTVLSHISSFAALSLAARRQHLYALIQECTPSELLFLSTTIAPLLKRDFLRALPPEVSLHILSFVDDPRTLARAARVSRYWNDLLKDDYLWKMMCIRHGFARDVDAVESYWLEHCSSDARAQSRKQITAVPPYSPSQGQQLAWSATSSDYDSGWSAHPLVAGRAQQPAYQFPYRNFFIYEHLRISNWLTKGRLLRTHRAPLHSNIPQDMGAPYDNPPHAQNSALPTSIAIDSSWVVVGLANSRIHIFSARTGVLSRTLVGHESGVWAVSLISEGGAPATPDIPMCANAGDPLVAGTPQDAMVPPILRYALGLDQPDDAWKERRRRVPDPFAGSHSADYSAFGKPSYPGGASDGWGQPNALVVSGGCDKELRVWDVKSGYCIYILRGHTSTIRCLKVLHGRPIAVSGSRDRTLRVWDIQRGRLLRVLEGHTQSVRCLDACGSRVVSGSYDYTCRVWDVDTGACLHVLRGHFHQIYTVAFDGVRIASGGIDTTVRVWDAATGTCLALLQGHTALVCQLQLSPTMLATGGSDGRVIVFSLKGGHPGGAAFSVVQRLAAHDSSVSGLQLDDRFLVTSGNDGRVRLYEFEAPSVPLVSSRSLSLSPSRSPSPSPSSSAAAGALARGGAGALGIGMGMGRGGGGGALMEPQCRYVRDMCESSESVWKVACTRETCAILCKRAAKMVVEIWSFKPEWRWSTER